MLDSMETLGSRASAGAPISWRPVVFGDVVGEALVGGGGMTSEVGNEGAAGGKGRISLTSLPAVP